MAEAKLDQNHVKSKLGILFSDGLTLVPITINPATGGVRTNTTDSVSPAVFKALRDQNFTPSWIGQSSVDQSIIPIFVDATGAILVDL
jgi:hypothetical protein